jgi:hypothetical protein
MNNNIFCIREDKISSYVIFTLANSCMPTLLNTKPATLVSFHKKYIEKDDQFFQVLALEVSKFKCNYEILFQNETTFYTMIYRKDLLQNVLSEYSHNKILMENGYVSEKDYFIYNLWNLKKRYQDYKIDKNSGFPHEVGIFLGYPIIDVEEFIKNNGQNYVVCGYWKVYHNVEEAGKTFEYFKRVREEAMELFFSGKELKEIYRCA